jgi:tetratricopeptide (TPR) repeat protein
VYALHAFQLHRDRGRLADIEESATAVVESEPDIPGWRPTYALLQLELGNHRVAEAELRRLVTHGRVEMPRDWLWLGALGHLAEVCAGVGDTDRAATLLRLLRPYARCTIVVANGALSMGSAARHLGLLCTTLGSFDEAERYFRTAIEVNTAWNAQPWLVRTYVGYAQLLRQRGDAGDDVRARRYADRGCAIAARLGMAVAARQPQGASASV